VPFFKRQFLGGASSLRGWGRFEVSPLSGSGLPIGGFSALESSGEVRVLVRDRLILVAFIDAGNAWARGGRLVLSELLYDVGPGLRYITPIGPIRVDLARQLTPIEGLVINGLPESRRWRLHIGIGQSF
jgi:translocation and assembly module TamA